MKRRWIKFKGKAPKFSDPAEATFEITTHDGITCTNCFWQRATVVDKPVSKQEWKCETFHTSGGIPILPQSISHYRRE